MKSKFLNIFIFIFLIFSLVGCAGEQGPVGPQGEQGIQGAQGEQGQPGKDGVDGQNGVNGKDGTSLLTGNGEPTNVIGIVGDSYIDLDTWSFYIKTTNGWVISGNIKGEKGDSAAPDHNGTEGLVFYPINDTECAVAVGNAKLLKEIIIPSKYKQYTVTTIYGNTNQDAGFLGCKSLEKIEIPDSVTTIGPYAFQNCSSLTSIEFPDSVASIGRNAFCNCTSLTSIIIPNSVKTIGESAFKDCEALSSIEFEENINLENIGFGVFSGCDSLKIIEIPNSVKTIGNSAFASCEALTSVKFYEDSELEKISGSAFSNCSKLTNIELPKSLKIIEDRAFGGCESLTKIFIPNDVVTLASGSFEGCNLVVYTSLSINECEWGSENFGSSGSILTYYGVEQENIIEENGVLYLYSDGKLLLIKYIGSELKVVIPPTINRNGISYDIATICSRAFYGAILEEVIILEGITNIESSSFSSCYNLVKIQLPSTLENIGESAFASCENLKEIIIPEGIKKIEEDTFYRCTSLSSVKLPSTLEFVERYSFAYCDSLTNIKIPSNVKTIGDHTFAYCRNLTTIIIPFSVSVIDSYALEQNYKLTIFSEFESQPDGWANSSFGWNSSWNPEGRPVYWAGQWEYDANGNPVPLN